MLKWTASAQKLAQSTPNAATAAKNLRGTPRLREPNNARRQRRATIANKENIPYTSTPMAPRARNSPLVLAPLADILNITPESSSPVQTPAAAGRRRHSTVDFSMPQYASTLPRYEEEYSPSAALPTGQQLALRGLLPQPFLGNARYFNTPQLAERRASAPKALPPKRKLAEQFALIAQEEAGAAVAQLRKAPEAAAANITALNSSKMGDQTLDRLIDAILDSARKDEKKQKKTRKSFNLRRRTLLKNQVESVASQDVVLSPSYAPGDDPASDLSFLLLETRAQTAETDTDTCRCATPAPATPPPGTPISATVLRGLPTPTPASAVALNCQLASLRAAQAQQHDSFTLHTPVHRLTKKRRQRHLPEVQTAAGSALAAKKFKVDARNYFELGLALPSIYV